MDTELLKQQVATAALDYVQEGAVLGVGSGSTIAYFIKALGTLKNKIEGAVASSIATADALRAQGIKIIDLNAAGPLSLYIDSADEVNAHLQCIKGGGGALTREKIIAAASKQFICLINAQKQVGLLGNFPLPVEVIPMARSYVARTLIGLGGFPVYRENFVTDNGNIILDVHNLKFIDPLKLEHTLNNITGVVCNGIFAARPADKVLVSSATGITVLS